MNRSLLVSTYLLLCLLGVQQLAAQPYNWHPTTIPTTGAVSAMFVDGSNMVIANYFGTVVCSSDKGATWTETVPQLYDGTGFAKSGTSLFLSSSNAVYRSEDAGKNWSIVDTAVFNSRYPGAIVAGGNDIVVADQYSNGVVVSRDGGVTWVGVSSGLGSSPVTCLASVGTVLLAGTKSDGVYRSTDGGVNWILANNALRHASVLDLTTSGTNVFLATTQGIQRSTDNGTTWTAAGLANVSVLRLFASGGWLYSSLPNGGVLASSDNGQNWHSTGLANAIVHGFAASGQTVYVGSQMDGYYTSTDNGNIWTQHGYRAVEVTALRVEQAAPTVFIGAGNSIASTGIYRSNDAGDHWTHCDSGMITSAAGRPMIYDIMPLGDVVLAGTDQGLFRSTDSGFTWIQSSAFPLTATIEALRGNRDTVYASFGDIFRSFDRGLTWQPMHCGFQCGDLKVEGANIGSLTGLTTSAELIFSRDHGVTWDSTFLQRNVSSYCFTANPSTLLAGSDFYSIGNDMGDLYPILSRTTDNGMTWNDVLGFYMTTGRITVFSSIGSVSFADTARYGHDALIFSKDDGLTWANAGLHDKGLRRFDHNDRYIFTVGDSIFRTTMAGTVAGVAEHSDLTGMSISASSRATGVIELHFVAADPFEAEITVTDILGKQLFHDNDGNRSIGERTTYCPIHPLSTGVVLVSVRLGDRVGVAKVVLSP